MSTPGDAGPRLSRTTSRGRGHQSSGGRPEMRMMQRRWMSRRGAAPHCHRAQLARSSGAPRVRRKTPSTHRRRTATLPAGDARLRVRVPRRLPAPEPILESRSRAAERGGAHGAHGGGRRRHADERGPRDSRQ